jgi:hypothetical protein
MGGRGGEEEEEEEEDVVAFGWSGKAPNQDGKAAINKNFSAESVRYWVI